MNYNFKYYAILGPSRSGSSHLCDILESTNRLGNPDEYFNKDMMPYYLNHFFPKNTQSYSDKITWHSKKENFVVGVKFTNITHLQTAKDFDFLDKIQFWIWIKREDKILQAISRYKSWKTGIWDHNELLKNKNKEANYNFDEIKFVLENIISEEKEFESFLEDKNYMEISYEKDIVESPEQTVISVLNFLSVPIEYLPKIKSNQKIMRNEESYRWKEKFISELKSKNIYLDYLDF